MVERRIDGQASRPSKGCPPPRLTSGPTPSTLECPGGFKSGHSVRSKGGTKLLVHLNKNVRQHSCQPTVPRQSSAPNWPVPDTTTHGPV